MTAVFVFFIGTLGLLVAGNLVVEAASAIGSKIGLGPTTVGLTIVAAGTSAPELAVVFQAIAADDTELAVGSIIGSNIANVLLVLGLAACFGTIRVTSRVVQVDIPVMISASLALLVLSLDGELGRIDGLLLLTGLVSFVVWTLRAAPREKMRSENGGSKQPQVAPQHQRRSTGFLQTHSRDLFKLLIGIGGLAFAAQYVVEGAEKLAVALGVPELIVGLTIVALGTSAPEIVTSLIAAFRGHRELAVGNAIGSNIFNILLVFGSAATVSNAVAIGADVRELDMPILLAAAVACLPIVFWDHKFDRWEGVLFVGYYLAYIAFLTLDATGNRASDRFAVVLIFFVMPLTAVTVAIGIVRQRSHNRAATTGSPHPP